MLNVMKDLRFNSKYTSFMHVYKDCESQIECKKMDINYHNRNTNLLLGCMDSNALLLYLFKVIFQSEMHWRYSMQTMPLLPPSHCCTELPFIFKKVTSLVHIKTRNLPVQAFTKRVQIQPLSLNKKILCYKQHKML